jgi:hypothetical protein
MQRLGNRVKVSGGPAALAVVVSDFLDGESYQHFRFAGEIGVIPTTEAGCNEGMHPRDAGRS